MQIKDYKTLPVGKYKEILTISKDQSLEEIDKQVKIISVLNDMTEDQILELPLQEYHKLSSSCSFLGKPSTEDHTRIADSYQYGDLTLIPTKDIDKMTTAQYVDFQTFSKDPERYLEQILSCFLIPKGCKYNQEYDIKEVQELIRDEMSVSDALSLLAFFFSRLHSSILNFLNSCISEANQIQDKEKREEILERIHQQMTLLRNGGGSQM